MHHSSELLSTAEVADRLSVDRSTVTRWVQSGRIEPAVRTPGGVLLFAAQVVADLEAQRAEATS